MTSTAAVASGICARAGAVLLAACTVVSLTACGSPGDDAGSGGTPSGAEAVGGDFKRQDLLVSAVCSPGSGGGGLLQVDGWNPRNWRHEAHAEFSLPNTVKIDRAEDSGSQTVTGLADLCAPDPLGDAPISPDNTSALVRIRSVFDRDFTRVAVVVQDRATGATHVGYVDRSGKLTDLTGPDQGFGLTPHERNAVFAPDGDSVWFTYFEGEGTSFGTGHIASRAVAGDHRLTNQWSGDFYPDLPLNVLGSPARGVLADSVHVTPDGRRMIAWAEGLDNNVLDTPTQSGMPADETAKNARFIHCDEVVGWTDNHTLLCGNSTSNFYTVDTTARGEDLPDNRPAGASDPLLPENDHENLGEVISPDGQRFVFVSSQGEAKDLYVAATKPGSTPQKIERTGDLAVLGPGAVMIDWR
ncbi:hypothetical protein AB0J86_13440 [Micromonospora sp. NPDC049559]|uniref:hypothetical protein n=1 Tax=Micromonospora sp. NPDC049559 TaxID=3155923 RepID=UPI00343FD9F3